jgi:hypothetical protein
LRAAVGESIAAWWGRWATLPCALLEVDLDELPAGHLQVGREGDVAVQVRGSLAKMLLGLEGDEQGLPAVVCDQAMRDLLECLGDGADADPSARSLDILPARLVDERLGACRIAWLDTHGHGLAICLARPAVDRIVPTLARTTGPAMTTRRELVATRAVALRAELDLGSIGLGELRGLQPGDVLLTRAPLERLGRLIVASTGHALAETHLGQHQGKRAIQLAGPLSSESPA